MTLPHKITQSLCKKLDRSGYQVETAGTGSAPGKGADQHGAFDALQVGDFFQIYDQA